MIMSTEAVCREIMEMVRLTNCLAESAADSILSCDLSGLPSNTIGQQFWCVAGARESYAKAIHQGCWIGFSCSIPHESAADKSVILAGLKLGEGAIDAALRTLHISDEKSEARIRLALECFAHEAQHQGQLIRYWYALGTRFPAGLASKWALEQPD